MFDGIKRQLRSVIEWQDVDPDTLLYQWSDNGDEIKNASKLIVGPGQGCIFVYEGKIRCILKKEKLISLQTDNIPFWTTLKKYMQFFQSEHKAAIYFYRSTRILNLKWGTTSTIKYEDPKYHFPVGLKAYGNYSCQIDDPRLFFADIVGQHQQYRISDFRKVMSERLIQPLSDFLSENRFSYTDIDANREEIARGMQDKLSRDFQKLGFRITDFRIEGTDFDEKTLERINQIADVTAQMHAARVAGLDYAGMQQIQAMRDAAKNEGGAAGIGMGIGAGMGFGQMMSQGMQNGFKDIAKDNHSTDITARLQQLKQLYEAELISEQEYQNKKAQILDNL